jgi:hypothetical protein
MASTVTYEQIARNYQLWGEYVDPMATMTEEEFDALEIEDRLKIMVDCFGPEEDEDDDDEGSFGWGF